MNSPYAIRLPAALMKKVKNVSEAVGLNMSTTLRQSIMFGLPLVRKGLTSSTRKKI